MKYSERLRSRILVTVNEYYHIKHNEEIEENKLKKLRVNYAGRIYDEKEMMNLVDSSLEFWLTSGRYTKEFEKKLVKFLNIKHALFVNSGSSANLLAFMCLTSHKLGKRRIKRGDEVITTACCFPTTVSPIIQYGAKPVFVDVEVTTLNINIDEMKKALSKKTKAVMIAHTLGNPFDIKEVKYFCKENNLWLIEDNCDSLGSKYVDKYTGTFGDIGTSSFFPPHHITTGEGGAVYTDNDLLHKIMLSMRDWGRDCFCDTGQDNRCGKRFTQKLGDLPEGYDHKYTYSHFGFNLKATDLQASIGCAQLDKLNNFIEKRKENFNYLYESLFNMNMGDYFIFPALLMYNNPSWFGFYLTVKDDVKFTRNEITKYLEDNNIQTRNVFAGNILKHPCFEHLKKRRDYRIIGKLNCTNKIMNNTFWIGVYPGLDKSKLDFMIKKIYDFVKEKQNE